MPKGKPLGLKCPKCMRGKFGHPRAIKGIRILNEHERFQAAVKGSAGGSGGATFVGHRGLVECLDCGHRWGSTHSHAKPIRSFNCGACRASTPLPHDPIRLTAEESRNFKR